MRKSMVLASVAAVALTAAGIAVNAQPYMGGNGPGNGQGPGYMMGPGNGQGYGPGTMMGPGYGYGMMSDGDGHGWMMGPGMMGFGQGGRNFQRGPVYRGQQLCWKQTNADHNFGYYEACPK